MDQRVTFIGFGEAGQAFAGADGWRGETRAYDRLTDDSSTTSAKQAEYAEAGVAGAASAAEAIAGAPLVISLVTADQALAVAREAADHIAPGALFCDLNSVAPGTKRSGAEAIEAAGGRYVDAAVLAPVNPSEMDVPLLLSGPAAADAAKALRRMSFLNLRTVGPEVGRASAIKMIRSVMVKGIEALTAEMMLAAEAAGVVDEVLTSLDASDKPKPWAEKAAYNIERMTTHGLRRAAEMEEVAKTLTALGIAPVMSEGTVRRQRDMAGRKFERNAA
jgi:3-hydroxyisobutyrate dehydrogenase-like beta-hydroxyacid dehydrogenase